MSNNAQAMTFEKFAHDLEAVFDALSRDEDTVLVEREGHVFQLQKVRDADIWAGYDPERLRRALRRNTGVLEGVDVEQLKLDTLDQREQGSQGRPA